MERTTSPFRWIPGRSPTAWLEAHGACRCGCAWNMDMAGRGENPPEIHALAEALFRGGNPLAQITRCSLEGNDLRASFECREPITKAELNYTTDKDPWVDRHWQTMPAELDLSNRMASAKLLAACRT